MHAGFIRHLPHHSSLCVSAIIHAKHFVFAPIIRINGHIHYSHVVVSARRSYQGYKAKHGLPSMYQTQTKMKLNDFIFYAFVKETFLFLPTKHYKKKKDYSAHTFAPFSLRHCDSFMRCGATVKHLQHPHLVPMSPLLLQRGWEEFRPSEMDVPRTPFVYCCWRGDRFRPVIWAFPFTAPSFPLPQSFHWFQHTSLARREYWLVKC